MRNLSIDDLPKEAIFGFLVGYLFIVLTVELVKLYTEWALEMERRKIRIYFEEKQRASDGSNQSGVSKSTDILTLEGRTS